MEGGREGGIVVPRGPGGRRDHGGLHPGGLSAWGRQCDQVDPWQAYTPTSCLTVNGTLPFLLPPSFSHPNAQICKSVVACRVSPDQKRSIVHLVKNNEPACRALSIGKAEEREGGREGGRAGGRGGGAK
jgi:hypothetical protein